MALARLSAPPAGRYQPAPHRRLQSRSAQLCCSSDPTKISAACRKGVLQQPVSRRSCSGGWARQLAGLGRPGNRRTLRQTRPRQSRPVAPHPRPEPWAVPAPDEESQGCQHQAQSRAQSRSSPRNLGRRGRHRCSSPGTCGPGHTCCRGQGRRGGCWGPSASPSLAPAAASGLRARPVPPTLRGPSLTRATAWEGPLEGSPGLRWSLPALQSAPS